MELNLPAESGTQPSFYPYCHHETTYAKFNFEIYYLHFAHVSFGAIKIQMLIILSEDINEFNWDRSWTYS